MRPCARGYIFAILLPCLLDRGTRPDLFKYLSTGLFYYKQKIPHLLNTIATHRRPWPRSDAVRVCVPQNEFLRGFDEFELLREENPRVWDRTKQSVL